MDSLALLACLHADAGSILEEGEIEAVCFKYPSKHNGWEREAAAKIADHYKVKLSTIDLTSVMDGFKSDLLQSGGSIPEGHYSDESMKSTVVPCRNMIFVSILAGLADSRGFNEVAIGIHAGDHAIYPDCRPKFKQAMTQAVGAATDGRVVLIAPFLNYTKTTIIHETHDLPPVPWHLSRTCYKDQVLACGKCGSCTERLEAFSNNGMVDPVSYQT